jgi:GNAT superfamily N-acetyltransferase
VLVAVGGGEVVGVGNIDVRGDVPVIWKLYVLARVQGSGIGSALLTALLDRVPPGTGSVRLEYADGNEPAAAFYVARGSPRCGGSRASGRDGLRRCGSSAVPVPDAMRRR